MAQPAPTFSAVSSLLQLLSHVRGQGDVGSAAEPRPEEELGDLFSQGHKLKQQLLAARTARLCRFLELTSAAGVTPHAATQRGSGARRRLGQRIDSAEEADSRPRGTRKAHWSPVSILEGAGACSNACSTPGSSRSVDSEASAASLPHTPVPYALEEWRQVAAAGAPKPAPPPPPLPPPPGVLRLGVRVMPPTALDISSPLISPRGRLVSQCKPAAPVQRQQQQLLPTGAVPHPPPPPPPPPLPKVGSKAAGLAPPPRPPPPPPPGGVASLPRVAVPEPEVGAAAGTRRTPPPPRQPGPLPAHLAAPPPREGVQRRPIHFDGVRPVQAQGSLWEQPPPEQEAADPAEAVRVDALDRLFAKHTLAPPDARDGSTAGSPAGSPRRPSVGAPAARRGSGHDEGSGSLGQAVSSADSEVCSVCGSPGRLVSRGGLSLARNKRPITRIFTGGRKAVNIEILLRKLGSPTTVAQAIAELDTKRLQVAILRELQANMPDATELEALHAYLDTGGDPSQLGRAEQLFVALRGTARLEQKLQVLVFAGSLQELGGEVTEPLGRIVVALDQLRCSAQLRLLLHTALRLGNALNAGRKAPQRGIRLAHLRKLADTKSLDGRTTLMHYLVALMLESVPGALLLGKAGSQCGAVPGARHWSFAELEAGLERLSAGIDMVWQEQRAACGGEQRQLGALAGQASALVQRAQQLLAAARQKAADTLRYLGDDVAVEPGFSATEPRRMLGDMGDFLLLLHKAHADGDRMAVCLETLRQQQEEAAEQGAPAAAGGEGASGVAAQEQAVP